MPDPAKSTWPYYLSFLAVATTVIIAEFEPQEIITEDE